MVDVMPCTAGATAVALPPLLIQLVLSLSFCPVPRLHRMAFLPLSPSLSLDTTVLSSAEHQCSRFQFVGDAAIIILCVFVAAESAEKKRMQKSELGGCCVSRVLHTLFAVCA